MAADIRVLIADDHPLLRQGIRQALELSGGIQVVAEAADGRECLEKVRQVEPDVVLMDLNMPGMNGLACARALKEGWPGVGIVVLTIHEEEEYLVEAVRAGVEGYLLKDVDSGTLVHAIQACSQGQPFLQPHLASRLMSGMRREVRAGEEAARLEEVLTQREKEVLHLLAEGVSNREISQRLYIAEKTVKNHTNSIFRKMGVADRTQAVVQAIRRGWVKVS